MSITLDKLKLIAEMRKRPALWDVKSEEHRSCLSVPEVWKDVAVSMESDVKTCQNTWENLCKTYRKNLKRKDSNKDYKSKWVYFEPMQFMKNIKSGPIKLRTSSFKFKLITEVQKRPALWDIQSEEHRSCLSLLKVWKDLANYLGSDVKTCQHTWAVLCKIYRRAIKGIELRINEDKLKGSYDPNKDYSNKWTYFEAMQFMKDIKSFDRLKLIAEVRKRPALWDLKSEEYKSRSNVQKMWKDVADIMGSDVEECTHKWTILRNNYQKEIKKIESLIEKDILDETYDTNKDYSCKWAFYEHMKFIDDKKQSRPTKPDNSSDNENKSDDNGSEQFVKLQSMGNIKMEPELDLDPEVYLPDTEDDDTQSSDAVKFDYTATHRSYTKRTYDQANFAEDVEKDEHNQIKSARLNATHFNDMFNVGDSDYNFLVSFLPQMKHITKLQNLQFRAKIKDLLSNIMSQSMNKDKKVDSKN